MSDLFLNCVQFIVMVLIHGFYCYFDNWTILVQTMLPVMCLLSVAVADMLSVLIKFSVHILHDSTYRCRP